MVSPLTLLDMVLCPRQMLCVPVNLVTVSQLTLLILVQPLPPRLC